ncbi:hypothetical protein [Paraburkholderia sp. BL21I4N1]|uniref:hypothetical protein n=1 Tax=Paraburkholderia sp. BL21I4N1 TaxID=1938801 RepID=UPI00215822B4|nr:hypothetical protein [Paraburkholderia sp. BL21I4N1]
MALPTRRLRLLPCLFGWILFCGVGAALVLLLWPRAVPAHGAWFWICLLGIPNGVFIGALIIARIAYEADCLYAVFRNRHRAAWLSGRVRAAQRPLQVLGAGYCLPLEGKSVGEVLAAKASLLEARVPRSGIGRVQHSRFTGDDPLFGDYSNEFSSADRVSEDAPDVGLFDGTSRIMATVPPVVHVISRALAPVVDSIRVLSQYGPQYAPVVRVLSKSGPEDARVSHVRQALERVGLPGLDCAAVPATEGLMPVDAWLDATERRPLLLVAAEFHDAPPSGSTEGAVAVLLGSGAFELPEPVKATALLHRPAADEIEYLDAVLANAVLWGNTDPATVGTAWLSGLDGTYDTRLLAALRRAGMSALVNDDVQRRPDRFIGHAGAAGGWMSVAAAFEEGGGTHVILHAPSSVSTVQAAILHVNDQVNNQELHDERTQ